REGNRVGDRYRRHIEERMNQHQTEEDPERHVDLVAADFPGPAFLHEEEPANGQPADEVTEGEELLRREAPIGELSAEEQSVDRAEVKGAEDVPLLVGGHSQPFVDVAEIQFEPRAPEEDL